MRLGEFKLIEQLPRGTAVAESVLNADFCDLYGTLLGDHLADRVGKSADNIVFLNGDDPARFLCCSRPGRSRLRECGSREWCLTAASAQLSPSLRT